LNSRTRDQRRKKQEKIKCKELKLKSRRIAKNNLEIPYQVSSRQTKRRKEKSFSYLPFILINAELELKWGGSRLISYVISPFNSQSHIGHVTSFCIHNHAEAGILHSYAT